MINFLLSFLLIISSPVSKDNNFEGSIKLIHETYYDTSYFTYYVKTPNIRIDQFDSNHLLEQSLLINLDSKQVYILSNAKKMYTKAEVKLNQNSSFDDNFTILKTENSRMVGDNKCFQWRVKNKERNTEVAYWVSQNNFYFFEDLVKILSHIDKTFEFFEKVPETQGFFPLLSVERTLLRKEKSRIYVFDIQQKSIQEDVFEIPSDYELVIR